MTSRAEITTRYARALRAADKRTKGRIAGSLLLLYGQHLSRIVATTHDQIRTQGGQVFLRLGGDDLHIPEPLAGLLQVLARDGRRYTGVGTPAATR